MSHFESRIWPANPAIAGRRTNRRGFSYDAFVPDPIAKLALSLSGELAAAVSAAEHQVSALNQNPPALANLEVLARRLLRAESVASSRIEGLELSSRRLAKAEAQAEAETKSSGGPAPQADIARAILGNVAAMEHAIQLATAGEPSPSPLPRGEGRGEGTLSAVRPLRVSDLLDIHRILMRATRTPAIGGRLRTQQNWLGGNSFNPANAEFVPPPPEQVPALMRDLVAFANRADLPPVVQAALAHAQFETIHPFADGNGRVGRALIHVVLRRRSLAPRYVPPVSLVLAADAKQYVAGLTAYRADRPDDWIRHFTAAVDRAARKATELAAQLAALQDHWRNRAGHPRTDSTAEALIRELPASPVVTLATAAARTGRSKQATNKALDALATAGILHKTTVGKRNRAWEATALFDLIDDFERERARPGPARPASGRNKFR